MADNGAVPEKQPIDDPELGFTENDDSTAKFINGGKNSLDDTQTTVIPKSPTKSNEFTGLGKDELMEYSKDPFWVRLRWILFILFWVGWLAMLVSAIVIIVLAPRCAERPDLKWYHKDVSYNVYSKSFFDGDSNQDGYGDLEGIIKKKDHVGGLGANTFWLSSIFQTDPNNDRAIIDHMKLDEKFGTVEVLRSFCKDRMKKGKRVIVDLIPNQTSRNHTWFKESSQKKDGKYSDYYIWADSSNGWTRKDGSSMWEKLPAGSGRDQYYLSQFHGLPDLNLTNPAVIKEFEVIMRYWASVGISGFHINDMEMLAENNTLADEATQGAQTRNFADNADVIDSLRGIVDGLDNKPGREKLLFGTVTDVSTDVLKMYGGQNSKKGLHITSVVMDALTDRISAKDLEMKMEPYINVTSKLWLGWRLTTSVPGTQRVFNRVKLDRMIPAYALQALLPGSSLPYYGDEITMESGLQNGVETVTPMQWNRDANAGFTKGTPWLAVNYGYTSKNLDSMTAQLGDNNIMDSFKNLTKLRESESFQFGKTLFCSVDDLFMFSRMAPGFESFVVVINMGPPTSHTFKGGKCIGDREKATLAFHSGREMELSLNMAKSIRLGADEVHVYKFPA